MSGPYGIGAKVYYEAGFSPLPAKGKLLMVTGASGRHPLASFDRIEYWIRVYSNANIALRLPSNLIALDIDVYKQDLERLETLESQLGTLPDTWNSDSRGGDGGKLIYKVPPGMKWQSSIGGITVIQHTHRYVMAFPSFNRVSDSRYLWYDRLGGEVVPDYQIPDVEELEYLPDKWIKALEKHEAQHFYNLEPQDIELDMFNDEEPCQYTQKLAEICKQKLKESYAASLHDTALSIIGSLMQAASNGHTGIPTVVLELGDIFRSAPRNRDLATEWFNIVDFVLANVEADSISEFDSCKLNLKEFKEKDDFEILMDAGFSFGQINRMLFRRRNS